MIRVTTARALPRPRGGVLANLHPTAFVRNRAFVRHPLLQSLLAACWRSGVFVPRDDTRSSRCVVDATCETGRCSQRSPRRERWIPPCLAPHLHFAGRAQSSVHTAIGFLPGTALSVPWCASRWVSMPRHVVVIEEILSQRWHGSTVYGVVAGSTRLLNALLLSDNDDGRSEKRHRRNGTGEFSVLSSQPSKEGRGDALPAVLRRD